jgi:NAD-dependent dihydropyrimidine dehydrogenase PreA subunit
MCEFCKEHGEGKKWYLQMKNYSKELFHEKLSRKQQKIIKTPTRLEWNSRFYEWFALPAMPVNPKNSIDPSSVSNTESHMHNQAPAPSFGKSMAGRKIAHFGQVIPIEDVENIIDMVDSITRFPCGCRYMLTGKADKRYCFGLGKDVLGIFDKYPESSSGLEVLEKQEAKKIIRDFDQEGLMHSVWTGITPYVIGICNCDRDCGAYREYIEDDGIPTFFHAEYICQVNWDLCGGCKSCLSQCQFGAMFYSSALAKVSIKETKCFGCGVCRAACPNNAISLIPRADNLAAANIWLKKRR